MNTELLEVQPPELRFVFEFDKQSSCSIRLANKSDYHVGFKVKTTCSTKYCVRPNTGVIKPNLTCEFTVTMQAQRVLPHNFICKDKFLIQSTIVPKGTKEENITSSMFAKEDGMLVEEKKLKVILVSPPYSPILSPMNVTSRIRPSYTTTTESEDDWVENNSSHAKVDEGIEVYRRDSGSVDELRLSNDVEEMKSKLREFESILRQENKQNTRTREIGFQVLFVFMVALASLYLGYMLHN